MESSTGVGLVGIVSALCDAKEVSEQQACQELASDESQVAVTDFPAPVVLDNLRANVKKAVPSQLAGRVSVDGHEWGCLKDQFSVGHANHFSRVIAADCFWMPQVHLELVQSMLHFLPTDPAARIFVISGFHTGRAKLAAFFDVASEHGLEIDTMYEENAEGVRREWARERDGGQENQTDRKKWLAIAILRRSPTL